MAEEDGEVEAAAVAATERGNELTEEKTEALRDSARYLVGSLPAVLGSFHKDSQGSNQVY